VLASRYPCSSEDSYDNAMAESIIGVYSDSPARPWRYREAVRFAKLAWVDSSLITVGCWNGSATIHRRTTKRATMSNRRSLDQMGV
jgi:hypothetical protein